MSEASIIEGVRSIAAAENWSITAEGDTLHLDREGITTRCHVDLVDDETGFIYLSFRTTSWQWDGERTDLHDTISLLLAACLRTRAIAFSPTLWDVTNPIVPVPETEVYGRYITLNQPNNSIIRNDEVSWADFKALLLTVEAFELLFPHLFTWEKGNEDGYSYTGEAERWASDVANIIHENGHSAAVSEDASVQFNQRWSPDWHYYRSIRKNITVVQSASAAKALQTVFATEIPPVVLTGPYRRLYIEPRVRSAVPLRLERLGRELITRLHGCPPAQLTMVPMENRLLFIGGTYILAFTTACGLLQFRNETRRIEERHRQEATLLFSPSHYTWADKVNDERFELLIRDLLEREHGVRRVRKVGHSRDADRGKDLIADWYTTPPPGTLIPEGCPPGGFRKVLVQVKAATKAVNKDTVRDIRDTLDDHHASGYFLAVASHITSDLTDHLDRLRTSGTYWADWWNRTEIEERLNRYPEIAQRYQDLVRRTDTPVP